MVKLTSRLQLKVRKASSRDLETLVRHRRAMWEDMGVRGSRKLLEADHAYREWARKRLKDRTFMAWVVEDQARAVVGSGSLWLQPIQPRPGYTRGFQPYLLSMYTKPSFREKGVASRIVKEAAKWTKDHRYPSLRLHASEKGRALYLGLGFERSWEMKLESPKRTSRTNRA